MKIQSNKPYYKNRVIRFGNEDLKFDNNGVANVKDEELAMSIIKDMAGFYEEGNADKYKSKKELQLKEFTDDVQKAYIADIEKLTIENESLNKEIEKLKVSEQNWKDEYQKIVDAVKAQTPIMKLEVTKEEPKKEEKKEEFIEDELVQMLNSLSKEDLKAFAMEHGVKEEEIGQKREKGIIELILSKIEK
jgi:hypothetical protein